MYKCMIWVWYEVLANCCRPHYYVDPHTLLRRRKTIRAELCSHPDVVDKLSSAVIARSRERWLHAIRVAIISVWLILVTLDMASLRATQDLTFLFQPNPTLSRISFWKPDVTQGSYPCPRVLSAHKLISLMRDAYNIRSWINTLACPEMVVITRMMIYWTRFQQKFDSLTASSVSFPSSPKSVSTQGLSQVIKIFQIEGEGRIANLFWLSVCKLLYDDPATSWSNQKTFQILVLPLVLQTHESRTTSSVLDSMLFTCCVSIKITLAQTRFRGFLLPWDVK